MEIVKASVVNAKDVAEVEFNSFYFWSSYSLSEELEIAKSMLREGKEEVFLVRENGVFLGYISINVVDFVGELGMSVRRDCQGRGVGSFMMEYIIEYSKQRKCKKLKLDVWSENLPAIRLYEKFGFKVVSSRDNYYPNGDSLIFMELEL